MLNSNPNNSSKQREPTMNNNKILTVPHIIIIWFEMIFIFTAINAMAHFKYCLFELILSLLIYLVLSYIERIFITSKYTYDINDQHFASANKVATRTKNIINIVVIAILAIIANYTMFWYKHFTPEQTYLLVTDFNAELGFNFLDSTTTLGLFLAAPQFLTEKILCDFHQSYAYSQQEFTTVLVITLITTIALSICIYIQSMRYTYFKAFFKEAIKEVNVNYAENEKQDGLTDMGSK